MKPQELEDAFVSPLELEGAFVKPLELEGAFMNPLELEGAFVEPLELEGALVEPLELEGALVEPLELEGAFVEPLELEGAFVEPLIFEGIHVRECRSRELWYNEAEKEQKQQHIYGTENISLKGCTTTGVRNYYKESSGLPDSDAAWNPLRSGRSRILPVASDIPAMRSSEGTCSPRNTKLSM
ncbi:hypothetical protein TNCV_4056951 [Trichonephila clavipes]|nr:hypothetical protein TNCV_4056951 [Trichonephila clavipes]